jgi:hypothetical protein
MSESPDDWPIEPTPEEEEPSVIEPGPPEDAKIQMRRTGDAQTLGAAGIPSGEAVSGV